MISALDLAESPTATVFANDMMAIAALSVAAQAGIDVPRGRRRCDAPSAAAGASRVDCALPGHGREAV